MLARSRSPAPTEVTVIKGHLLAGFLARPEIALVIGVVLRVGFDRVWRILLEERSIPRRERLPLGKSRSVRIAGLREPWKTWLSPRGGVPPVWLGIPGPASGAHMEEAVPAERVNCGTYAVAALPDAVGDAEAATLPVAGLTALHALRQGGLLSGARCLVDGAHGGS